MTAEANWYVAYVHSRSEKKVAERLSRLHITHYLPLVKTVRQWSDRKKTVTVPLFNGYIFVQSTAEALTQIRMVQGVVNYIYSNGKPAIVPLHEIQTIQQFINSGIPVDAITDTFAPGEQVRITFGPLIGTIGELIDVRNEKQFAVRIALINQVVTLKIPAGYLERVRYS